MQRHKKHFLAPFFARGLAQTLTQHRNKMHHREKCAAQSDSKKVGEEEGIARALAHNISQQMKKLPFLRNGLHLSTHRLSNGRLTLWRWLCGLVRWLGLTSWLLEWSSGPGFLGPRLRCRFLRCLALGDLLFLLLFFLALLLLIYIAPVGMFTGTRFRCLRLGSSLLLLGGRFLTSLLPLCCRGLCFCSLTLLNNPFLFQLARIRIQLFIPNPKGNTTVCPVGLLVAITRLVQFRPLCQDMVQLILHSVDPIGETVGGDTKKLHARIWLDGSNLAHQVWLMINEHKRRLEALSLLQVMEVSVEIPHNMRYRQKAAKFSVNHLLYLSRSKPQIIRNLQRERSFCARPRAERGRNDEVIPFSSSYPVMKSATSKRRTM